MSYSEDNPTLSTELSTEIEEMLGDLSDAARPRRVNYGPYLIPLFPPAAMGFSRIMDFRYDKLTLTMRVVGAYAMPYGIDSGRGRCLDPTTD